MPYVDEAEPPEVTIDTDAQLLRTPQVLSAVADALGTDQARAADALSVTASPSSRVLHVTVTTARATDAAAAANAAVEALIQARRHTLGALRNNQLRQLQFLALDQERVLARAQSRRLVVPVRDDLFDRVVQVRTRMSELEAARQAPAQVVGPALAPTSADRANTEVPVTSGAMLGLLGGCLLGATRDRSLNSPQHIKENTDAR
jgi:hypothetical protein